MALTATINPRAVGTDNAWVSSLGGTDADKVTATNDASDASYIGAPVAGDDQTFYCDLIAGDSGSPVHEVKVRVRALDPNVTQTTSFYIRARNGSDVLQSAVVEPALTAGWHEYVFNNPSGGPWTVGAVNGAQFGVGDPNWSGNPPRILKIEVVVTYDKTPSLARAARDVATRHLLTQNRVRRYFDDMVPLRLGLDIELGDLFAITHYMGPDVHRSTTGTRKGWGAANWERMLARATRIEVNLDDMTVNLRGLLTRNRLYTYRAIGRIIKTYSQQREGVGVVTNGGQESFTRAGNAWVRNAGDDLYYQIGTDIERNEALGTLPLLESARQNLITRSSAVSGLTGLTSAGASGSITAETIGVTDSRLFSSTITTKCYKFQAGSPHTADLTLTWAATASLSANTKCRFGIWHKDGASTQIGYRISRSVDGKYWRDSDGTWQVAVTTNLVTTRTGSVIADNVDRSKVIDVGGSSTTLTLVLVLPNGSASGENSRVYHVQLVDGWSLSGPIVTDAAAVTRAVETWTVDNDSGMRSLNNGLFSFMCEFIPNFDAADVPSGTKLAIWTARYDADDYWLMQFSGTDQRWEFVSSVAGSVTTAYIPSSLPQRGVAVQLGCRATGTNGELALSNRTLSVFAGGVKGTDAVRGGDPTEASPSDLLLGSDTTLQPCNGWISDPWFTQQALTDAEMAYTKW